MATELVRVQNVTFGLSDVKAMLEQAVQASVEKVHRQNGGEVWDAMRSADCEVCDRVRYELAKAVADYLGAVDETVKAVYLYEPEYATDGEEGGVDAGQSSPGINVIVWVTRKSAALTSVIDMLNAGLAQELQGLACPKSNALCFSLDAQIVDDDQVLRRSGYAALIDSLYVRPIDLWHR
jgi:hypothetical protein